MQAMIKYPSEIRTRFEPKKEIIFDFESMQVEETGNRMRNHGIFASGYIVVEPNDFIVYITLNYFSMEFFYELFNMGAMFDLVLRSECFLGCIVQTISKNRIKVVMLRRKLNELSAV